MILILFVALLGSSERVVGNAHKGFVYGKDIDYINHHYNGFNYKQGPVGHIGGQFEKYIGPQDYAAKDCKYGTCQDNDNLVGLGPYDNENHLINPCSLKDWQCIRKFFADNSNCKPAYGPVPDPLFMKRNTVYYTYANTTILNTDLRTTGLRSIRISKFYVNTETKNLVIALDFQYLNGSNPQTYIRFHRPGKESIVLSDSVTYAMGSGTFTAVIPGIPHLRLDLAEVHAYTYSLPYIAIGAGALASSDPVVMSAVARIFSDLQLAAQEFFLLQSQILTAIYIQENICNFGLKLISI